jgi:hypothetical protein
MPAGKRVEPHEAAMIRRYLEEASLSTQPIANKNAATLYAYA